MSRIRRPETVRLSLTQDDWILVKKHLTAGEERRVYTRMIKTLTAGERATLDPEQAGLSQMIEYLLDWSIQDPDGKPIPMRDQTDTHKAAALCMIDPEKYTEIREAIQAHNDAMEAERTAEKKLSRGENTSSPISESPVS